MYVPTFSDMEGTSAASLSVWQRRGDVKLHNASPAAEIAVSAELVGTPLAEPPSVMKCCCRVSTACAVYLNVVAGATVPRVSKGWSDVA